GLVVRHRHAALRRRPRHQRLPTPRTGSTTRGRRRGDVRRAGPLGPRDDADPSDDPRGIQPRVVAPDLSEHGPRPVPRRGHWPLVPDEGARPSIPRRELGAPRGRMDFETWQPFYEQILNDFGFSREKDEAVAAELDKLLGGNRVPDSILRKIIRGKEVTVAGNGPNLEDEIGEARGGLLTADEAPEIGRCSSRITSAPREFTWSASTSNVRMRRTSIGARNSGSSTGRTSSLAASIGTNSNYETGFRAFAVRQLRIGSRAAWTSSTRATAVLCGAECKVSGSSFTIFASASTKPSSVSFVSVSVGSTMSASSTRCGKYTVGGWYPKSMRRFARSTVRTPFSAASFAALATNSCFRRPPNGTSRTPVSR